MSFKNDICTDPYFYETFCLEINWNLDRVPLRVLERKKSILMVQQIIEW